MFCLFVLLCLTVRIIAIEVKICFLNIPNNFRWVNLGTPLAGNNSFTAISDFKSEMFDPYLSWTLVSVESVTHDVDHFVLEPPKLKVSRDNTIEKEDKRVY